MDRDDGIVEILTRVHMPPVPDGSRRGPLASQGVSERRLILTFRRRVPDTDLLNLGLRAARRLHSKRPSVLEIDVGKQITHHTDRKFVVDVLFCAEIEGAVDILEQGLE